jgi:rhodanese-related sulfurtransferase
MKINVSEAIKSKDQGKHVLMIDVRTPIEYTESHIQGSLSMPLDRLDPQEVKHRTAGVDLCILICRSGKRAEQAYQQLKAANCESLAILDGGITAWEEADLPLERCNRTRLPLMRQVQLIIGVFSLIGSVLALTIDESFALIPAFLGAGLTMAGATGWCGLAIFLSKMPWNKIHSNGSNRQSCQL